MFSVTLQQQMHNKIDIAGNFILKNKLLCGLYQILQ